VVGEEIATLVTTSVLLFEVELRELPDFDDLIFSNYLEGLREAGWQGDPRMVRLGYTAATALRFGLCFLPGATQALVTASDHSRTERVLGHPIEEIAERRGHVLRRVLASADEARALMHLL
jgi:hypothetical protein